MLSLLLLIPMLFGQGNQPVSKPEESSPPYTVYLPLVRKAFITQRISPDVSPAATALAVSPANSAVVYAGTYGGGVFKSVDSGGTWKPASLGLPDSASIVSMAIDPSNANRIYVGLSYNNEPNFASGVYRSEDAGVSWAPTGRMDNPDAGPYSNRVVVYAVRVSPDGSVIYAATRTRVPVPPYTYGYGGVFKSINHGASWSLMNAGLPTDDLYIYDVAIDLTDNNWVYAGLHGSGVYRSTNGGNYWYAVNLGLPADVVNTTAHRSLVIDHSAENRLLFATTEETTYTSSNYANSWAPMSLYNAFTFAVDYNRDHAVYATDGLGSVYYSTNFGTSWDKRANAATDGCIAADPNNFGVLYAGGANGAASIKKSTDGGDSFFTVSQGVSGYPVTSVIADPAIPKRLFISYFGWGVMTSNDGGANWWQINSGLPTLSVQGLAMDPHNSDILYAFTLANGVYTTTNGGASWSALNSGYPTAGAEMDWSALPYRETGTLESIFAQPGAEDSTLALNAASPVPGLSAAVSPVSSGVILVGTVGRGVIRWNGTGWAATTSSAGSVPALLFDADASGRVWAGGNPAAGSLQVSTDQGATWSAAAAGLDGRTVFALSQGRRNPDMLLAGTDAGVYLSTDRGANWALTGLAGQAVRAVAVHPLDSSRLLAATAEAIYINQDGFGWTLIEPGYTGYGYLGVTAAAANPGYFYFYSRYGGVLMVNQ